MKVPFMIYADLECLVEKMHSFQNKPEKFYTEKKTKHKPSGYSLFTNFSFDATKNKLDCYKGEVCMEKFCKDLREHVENECYETQKVCHICKKKCSTNKNDENAFNEYNKARDHCNYTGEIRGAAHSIWNLRYLRRKEIPVIFHNGCTYGYHFIMKQLAKEFEGKFKYIGENTEKYITFSVTIKKELDNSKTITYKLKFIDSFRFMSTSPSSLVDNSSEKLHSDKCEDCESELDYMSVKDLSVS